MIRNLSTAMMLAAVSCLWADALSAEEEKAAVPLHFFACNFVEGKTMSDLDNVIERFDRWATRHDAKYTAWVLTPRYYSSGNMFDVGWLGTWPDGRAFGTSQDEWNEEGGEILRAFGEVMDCSGRGQQLASSVAVYAPDGPPSRGVMMFSHCNLKEGKNLRQAYQASRQLAETLAGLGSKAGHFMFYPGLGGGDLEFDFWRVTTFNNYTELGEYADIYLNRGGWDETERNLSDVASCTSPNTFDARRVRSGISRPKDKL